MSTLVQHGLSNLLAATVLAIMVLIITRLGRRPALAHSLWLIVLVKLVTPPLILVPLPWLTAASSLEEKGAASPVGTAFPVDSPPVPAALAAADDVMEKLNLPATSQVQTKDSPQEKHFPLQRGGLVPAVGPSVDGGVRIEEGEEVSFDGWMLAGGLWLGGSLFWFLLTGWRAWRFQRLLRHARPADGELQSEAQRLACLLGLRRCPRVWLISGKLSPLLWSFLGPARLLVPEGLLGRLDSSQRTTLLLHELAHWLRRDHVVRHLELLVLGLYWWCPLVWWVRRELHEVEEQCCDAWVVWALPESARAYATALVETVEFLANTPRPVPVEASGLGRLSLLKRRVTMILRGTTPRHLTWVGGLAVLGLAALLLPIMPTWAQNPTPAPPTPGIGQEKQQPGPKERERQEQLKKIEVEIRALHEQIEKQQRDLENKMRELNEARRKLLGPDHKPDGKEPPHRPFPGTGPKPPQPPDFRPPDFTPPQPPFGGPGQGVQRRLAEVERKLEELMREIRELRQHRPGVSGPGPKGSGSGPKDDKREFDQPRDGFFPGKPGDPPRPVLRGFFPGNPADPPRPVRPVSPDPGHPIASPGENSPVDPMEFPPLDPARRPQR